MFDIGFLSTSPLANASGSDSAICLVTEPRALASGDDDKKKYQACLPKAHIFI